MVKAEQLNKSITLYEADAMDVLPTLGKVDAVVTDPPFGTDVPRDGYGRRQLWGDTRRIEGDSDLSAMANAMKELPQILQPDSWVISFASPKRHAEAANVIEECGLKIIGEVIWDKACPGLGGGIRYQHELIMLASNGVSKGRSEMFSILRYVRMMHAVHPHEKPVGLIADLIRYCSDPGDTILDPFAGSGTTGIAALLEGRKAILIEKDPRYADVIRQRIEKYECQQPGSIFRQELSLC